jgi:hypothetical protein
VDVRAAGVQPQRARVEKQGRERVSGRLVTEAGGERQADLPVPALSSLPQRQLGLLRSLSTLTSRLGATLLREPCLPPGAAALMDRFRSRPGGRHALKSLAALRLLSAGRLHSGRPQSCLELANQATLLCERILQGR